MKDLVEFLKYISKLKLTVRTGWDVHEVSGIRETIGSHSFGTAFLAWMMAKEEKVDVERTVKLALVHDLLEGMVGDLTPHDKTYKIKDSLEKDAITELNEILPARLKDEVRGLVKEFIEGRSKESKIVKKADKMDTLFQAYLYEKEKYGKDIEGSDLSEFFDSAEKRFKKGFEKKFLMYVKSLREK